MPLLLLKLKVTDGEWRVVVMLVTQTLYLLPDDECYDQHSQRPLSQHALVGAAAVVAFVVDDVKVDADDEDGVMVAAFHLFPPPRAMVVVVVDRDFVVIDAA